MTSSSKICEKYSQIQTKCYQKVTTLTSLSIYHKDRLYKQNNNSIRNIESETRSVNIYHAPSNYFDKLLYYENNCLAPVSNKHFTIVFSARDL